MIDKVQKINIIKVLIKEILIMSNNQKKERKDAVLYHYYNCNPQHRLTDDCVIRAITACTGDSWKKTMKQLTEYSIKTGYMLNTPECYGEYLKDKGFVKQKQPTHKDGTKVRVEELVKIFDGHAVCHCGMHHVTYVADNSAWDIWDVSNEVVGNYWVHESELNLIDKMEK